MTARTSFPPARLNALGDLIFAQAAKVHFDYHNANTFPVNVMVLVLEDDGQGRDWFDFRAGGQRLPMLADHVYLLPCNLEIRFDITPGVTFIAIHFNLLLFHGLDVFSTTRRCTMRRDPGIVARIRALLEDEADEMKAMCELKAEVLNFCASCWPEDRGWLNPVVQKYEPMFRYVREHGDAELNVAALAAWVGLRPDVFSRNFRRDLGFSPKEFLQNDLLKKTSARLLMPGAGVKETAAALKFSSEFYLSRFFKKHTGLSPRDYQLKFRR